MLRAAGWRVRDGTDEVSPDLSTYCRYIATSRGEFSVAKHAYVHSRSGWFSDRSASYLASGKPVILQDTGLSHRLPSTDGLQWFSTADEAVAALQEVMRRYPAHAQGARRLAREQFDYRVVLPALLERAMRGSFAADPAGGAA